MSGRVENLQDADGRPVSGAEPRNRRALKHGMYAVQAHSEAAVEFAEFLRESSPLYQPAFEPLIESTALLYCQVAAAAKEPPKLGTRASADLRGRQAELRRHMAELGMTPMAMARLGLDLARGEAVTAERLRSVDGAGARAEARLTEGKP